MPSRATHGGGRGRGTRVQLRRQPETLGGRGQQAAPALRAGSGALTWTACCSSQAWPRPLRCPSVPWLLTMAPGPSCRSQWAGSRRGASGCWHACGGGRGHPPRSALARGSTLPPARRCGAGGHGQLCWLQRSSSPGCQGGEGGGKRPPHHAQAQHELAAEPVGPDATQYLRQQVAPAAAHAIAWWARGAGMLGRRGRHGRHNTAPAAGRRPLPRGAQGGGCVLTRRRMIGRGPQFGCPSHTVGSWAGWRLTC